MLLMICIGWSFARGLVSGLGFGSFAYVDEKKWALIIRISTRNPLRSLYNLL